MRLKRQSPQHEDTSAARKARRARRLWIAADVAAVTMVGSGLWWQWLNVVPVVNIPSPPPLPSPNAFDTFSKASGYLVEKDVIDSANSKGDQLPKERSGVPYLNAEMAAAVAANTKAVTTLRSGFSQQYQNPSRRSFDAKFPELAKFREMARLLNLEGQVRETNGDLGGAAQSRLDAMRLGIEVPRGGNLIHFLVGIACEAIGRRPLWTLADKLSASEAQSAAKRLEEIEARRVPPADSIQEEKWSMVAGLLRVFPKSISPLVLKSKSQVITDHGAYMDALTARVRLPYMVASRSAPPTVPGDAINAMLCPVFEGIRIKEADTQMQNSLLITVLALRAYQAGQGTYPEDLKDIVRNSYLVRVPSDPFSSTGHDPLQYRRLENGKYLLYSIGPDGIDDDGTPIHTTYAKGKSKYWVEADMKGDFVVGVNNVRTEKAPER